MYSILLLNQKGERFVKEFTSPYLGTKFLNKARRSKKLVVLGYNFPEVY